MEARNLTTAREMLQKGNWFDPTMNGEHRFEKPPLPTWTAALAMHLFGQDNLSLLRLPAGLAGILLVFFLFQLTKELTEDKKLPYLAAATAATSFLIIYMSRIISWDIFCHSFMLGAIWLIHKGLKIERYNLGCFIGAGILMGLSFLSKGPIAFFALLLPYLTARVFAYEGHDVRSHGKPLAIMSLIALVISSAWPLYIYFKHPDFSEHVAQKESTAWIHRHTKPFYYYWSFPMPSGIWAFSATVTLFFPYARKRIDAFGNYKFLALWVVSAVLLLSIFPEKKPRYLLPALIPISLLTAFYFRYLIESFKESRSTKSDTVVLMTNGLLTACVGLIAPFAVWHKMGKNGFDSSLLFKSLSLLVFWSLSLFVLRSALNKKPFAVWLSMVAFVCSSSFFILGSARELVISNRQYRPYEELRHRQELTNVPFFSNGDLSGKFVEVVWASGHEIRYWDPQKESALPAAPPLVLVSRQQPFEVLPKTIQDHYEVTNLGLFDQNFKRSHYPILENYITVIRSKTAN